MSIATALQNAQAKVAAAYAKCNDKGATMPVTQDLAHLDDCIDSIPTGSTPNLQSLNVTPSTSAQQITPISPVDGYDEVNVDAVTSAIDPNIVAGNIKKDVSILGVTGTYEGSGGDPDAVALLVVMGSVSTDSALDITADMSRKYLGPILGNANRGSYLFANTALRDAIFKGVSDMSNVDYCFSNTPKLRNVSFPDLVTINGNVGMCFYLSSLEKLDLPELVTAPNGLKQIIRSCSALSEVNMPKYVTNDKDVSNTFLSSGNNLKITIHPLALKNSTQVYNILGRASACTTLILSQTATDDVYMNWCTALSTDSILGVLNKLDDTVTGKTCAFPTKTIDSSDPNYAAISAKVAALTNWTITGLTL